MWICFFPFSLPLVFHLYRYASSGEPTCEGFAPRQSASLETIEEMGPDSASVSSAEDSDEDLPNPIAPAHRLPNLFWRLIEGGHGDFSDESDEDESDEDEEGDSSENDPDEASDERGPMFLVADPRAD